MCAAQRLFRVRALHTAIYVVMAGAVLAVLLGGITGRHGAWLWAALALSAVESVVFIGSGMKCPLTAVAARYGAAESGGSDTFFPERITRHTLQVFGPMLALGIGLVIARWAWLGWRP